jgi:hypothetical protein
MFQIRAGALHDLNECVSSDLQCYNPVFWFSSEDHSGSSSYLEVDVLCPKKPLDDVRFA